MGNEKKCGLGKLNVLFEEIGHKSFPISKASHDLRPNFFLTFPSVSAVTEQYLNFLVININPYLILST